MGFRRDVSFAGSRALFGAAVAASVLLASTLPVAAQSQTVGLFQNDDTSSEGYTIFGPRQMDFVYLLDNGGRIVRSWDTGVRAGLMAYLTTAGTVMRAGRVTTSHANFGGGGHPGGLLRELDWDGTLIWSFDFSDADNQAHHDIEPLPNGNVLMIAWEYKTDTEAIAEGRDPGQLGTDLWPLQIVEVEPTPPVGGNIVWEWHLWDHLIQDFDLTKANFGVVTDHPELVDLNFVATNNADWIHANGIGYNAQFDQIIVSSRHFDEFWVIDHSTTTAEAAGHTGGTSGKGGDLLYRWGNPAAYDRGLITDQRLFGQHDPQWIAPGLPGAGNILVYNNGFGRTPVQYSTVDEIVPPVDGNGNYTQPAAGQPFGPASPTWSYEASPVQSFYSPIVSGAQRLPNGNTLIDEGTSGHFFEVTSSFQTVWEYISPVNNGSILTQGDNVTNNNVFKIRRYAADYTGLAGKDLTPGDPLELFTAPAAPADGSIRATRQTPTGSTIDVTWDATTCSTFDYNLIYGDLATVGTHALLGAECSVGIGGSFTWNGVPAGSLWFLVVGENDDGLYESTWGFTSSGAERGATRASFLCGVTTKVATATCP